LQNNTTFLKLWMVKTMRSVPSLLALLLAGTSLPALASDSYFSSWTTWWQEKTWRPVIALGAGTSTTSTVGQSQTFPNTNPVTSEFYYYQAYRPTQTSALGNLFIGAEWQLTPDWLIQGGLDYTGIAAYSAKGTLVQGADAISANVYNYSYNVLARQLMAAGKLLYSFKQIYHPYIFVGLGSSFNRAYNFKTTVPPFLTFTRQYNDYWNDSFTYSIGIGIDTDVYRNVRLGLGYRFADLGTASFNYATIDTTKFNNALSQSHIYSNQVLAQLTWVIQ
jgi:opacity protein-like surface antigen